jgi:hypothetical protein
MEELLRSNDLLLVARVEAILTGADIPVFIADRHVSAIEGSIGAFPRRVLVPKEALDEARQILADFGFEPELRAR